MSADNGFQQFVNDDDGYLRWLAQNPNGFVVNSNRVPVSSYLILHRASCKWINTSAQTNWTTTGYIKTCSNDLTALTDWAEREVGGSLKPCKSCQPDSESASSPVPRLVDPISDPMTDVPITPAPSPAGAPLSPGKRTLPPTISTGCPELDLAWQTYASMILNRSQILIPDTDDDLTWHAFLGHSIDMQGFRAAEFAGVDPLTREAPKFVPLKTRGIGVPELASLWEVPEIRKHLLGQNKDAPFAVTLGILREHGGEVGVSLADAFEFFPWRKFHWSVRALLQNSAVLKPFEFSFRRWLQYECERLGVQEFPPANFRRAVTFQGTREALEWALRKRLEQTFYMVGPAMSAYMLCDWQLWLWREGLTAVFANFKLDSFHEAFVKKFGKGVIPADEEGFAHWWHDLLPELPPRLANECIWVAVEKKLVDLGAAPQGETAPSDGYTKEELAKAKEEMRQILIQQAKQRKTIPYSDLVAQIKAIELPRNSPVLWNMLGEISTAEDAAGRGMLTVIVVHGHGDTLPGAGFFKLARSLGRHVSDERAFWTEELKRVYASWSTSDESAEPDEMTRPEEVDIHDAASTDKVTTKFEYPRESEFIGALRQGVKAGKSRLQEGYPIEIRLKPGGYAGKGTVIISADDAKEFGVVGAIKNPERFSRRIRVAAWALFEEEVFGRFLIKHFHDTGIVTIEREDDGNRGTTTSTGAEQGRETSGDVLVIVPCGRNKVWDNDPDRGPVEAKDAYTSLFFTTNRAYAERFGSRWVILSAKYGFIRPDFQIPGPYNVSFKDPATKPVEAHTLIDQIKELGLGEAQRVIGLGGKEYRAMIKEAFAPFGCPLGFPFAGLPIGEMIQATKRAIESGKFSG